MKIKEATYKACQTCDHKTRETDEEYGCDECRKPIDYGGEQRQYLRVNIFHHGSSPSTELHLCSWKCAMKALKKVKSDYFVSLPYLHYDERQKGIRANDFFDAIKAFK